MAGERVEYQVCSVVYLEPGRMLSARDLTYLWTLGGVFGKHQSTARFWHEGTVPDPEAHVCIQLGDSEFLDEYAGPRPILGGASCGQPGGRFQDCDFFFCHESTERCFGYETLPLLMTGCSGQWFERAGSDVVVELFRKQLELCDQYRPPYAFVDVAASEDCYSGFAYVSCFSLNNRLHRWSEHIKFLYACAKRRDQARGVYWGNYFGPAILNRLGGREQFLARFREHARDGFGRPNARIWEFTHGVFVSLCLDPLGCKPGQPLDGSAGQNLHWLLLELGSRGILNPWADEQAGTS